jgi:peptide/nickel transport system permease protein
MKTFIAKRALEAAMALLLLAAVVFLGARVSGDPAHYLLSPEAASSGDLQHLKHLLGLDRPLPVQFWIFVKHALRGDLGTSFIYDRPVGALLAQALPATIELAVTTMALSILLSVPLGVLAALRRGTRLDRIITTLCTFGMAVPQFWLGIMLIVLFAGELHWLPAYGSGSLKHLILPAVTLSLSILAAMVRLVRSSMLEVLESDYVKFARMKGLSSRKVIWKHALRNALIPVVTFSGITLGQLLNGVIVVETVFGWPGLGNLTVQAAVELDFPVLQGAVLLDGIFFIGVALLVDLLYAALDPRRRLAY